MMALRTEELREALHAPQESPGYRPGDTLRVRARHHRPADTITIRAGADTIRGKAWSGAGAITEVGLSVTAPARAGAPAVVEPR